MEIPTTQLIGDEKAIKVHFNLGNSTLLDRYQLRITVIEQKLISAKDAVAASQITYKNAAVTLQTFSSTYIGALSEFINHREVQVGGKAQIDFNLLPPEQVIKLKLQFDLLQLANNNQANITRSITVEWMIKEIIFNVISDEKGTFITLQSLKEDIKDLHKTIVNISSIGDNVFFLVDGKKTEVANLAQ